MSPVRALMMMDLAMVTGPSFTWEPRWPRRGRGVSHTTRHIEDGQNPG